MSPAMNVAWTAFTLACLLRGASAGDDDVMFHVQQLSVWMQSKPGGYLNPKVEIRRMDPSDPTSYFGVFASQDLDVGEVVMKIPGEIKLHIEDEDVDEDDDEDDEEDDDDDDDSDNPREDMCELAWALQREFTMGDDSDYSPYVNYLKALPRSTTSPSMWSDAGKELLMNVQGGMHLHNSDDGEDAEGRTIVTWIEDNFQDCLHEETTNESLDPYFLAVVFQRGFEDSLVPIYDMINHNYEKQNVRTTPHVLAREGFSVVTTKEVSAGEEFFYSYYYCHDCGQFNGGTAEMLRDFGFVEDYPHRFHITDDLTLVIEKDPETEFDAYFVTYDEESKSEDEFTGDIPPHVLEAMESELKRLEKITRKDVTLAAGLVPDHEHRTINAYYQALTKALGLIIEEPGYNSD